MTKKMLINLERCIGCWTCSMACKTGNHLEDDQFRIVVRTNGSGAGLDRPAGIYPNLNMSWMPIYRNSCTFCPDRSKEGELPFCAYNCPTKALSFGDDNDPESDFCKELNRCKDGYYHVFELPPFEESRSNVCYTVKA